MFLRTKTKPKAPSVEDAVEAMFPKARALYQAIHDNPESIGFNSDLYLRRNPDVAQAGVDPLVHFVQNGRNEGRAETFFFSSDWHDEMNERDGVAPDNILLHLAQTRSDPKRKKVAFFGYAWNSAARPDAYMREMIETLAGVGVNVDVYIAGHYSANEGTKGFRLDKSAWAAFLRAQSYDFALSFNNSMILPETVGALDCKIVSVLVDSIHHLFDPTDKGMEQAFTLPIHAAPIYTSFIKDMESIKGTRASASFLPGATKIEDRKHRTEPMEISWVASMLGDPNLDQFLSRIARELSGGMAMIATCLAGIEKTGEIGLDPASQQAAAKLCIWSRWDYPLLEMHLQEIVTNAERVAVVEKLSPLGLRVFGNARWEVVLAQRPSVIRSFRPGAHLRSHADLCAIYDSSKISINLPQVHAGTGMQYRILDVLASKSLLITKYVPDSDMERLFGNDAPIVTFTDLDDLEAKCAYYLRNEDERLARVKACNEMVATGYSFRERVLEYLELSNPGVAGEVGGRGSVSLIWPDRVIAAAK